MKPATRRHPHWLKVSLPAGQNFHEIRTLIKQHHLHTVCQSARCPNIGECWNSRTATFMILGDVCTRNCRFCAVNSGIPSEIDCNEPYRVANAVKTLTLKYAVITSVTRDDLSDGGATIFAKTVEQIHLQVEGCKVEVLIPDFQGDKSALDIVISAQPEVVNHNLETVPRLYHRVRPQAYYDRSLRLLNRAKQAGIPTKTGLMLGLGETIKEVEQVMADLRAINCDILTLGQYLQPSFSHLPVSRYVSPQEFNILKQQGIKMGFQFIESGPLVRSSYHATSQSLFC